MVNINTASQTGSGNVSCYNGTSYCLTFEFQSSCNDLISLDRMVWNDPDASCATGPETDCYWANVVISRPEELSFAMGFGAAAARTAHMGAYEYFMDTQGFGPYIAPSPPASDHGMDAYNYYSGRRRLSARLRQLRKRQETEIFEMTTAVAQIMGNRTRRGVSDEWLAQKRRLFAEEEEALVAEERRELSWWDWMYSPPPAPHPPPSPAPPPDAHNHEWDDIVEAYYYPLERLQQQLERHLINGTVSVDLLANQTYRVVFDLPSASAANMVAGIIGPQFVHQMAGMTALGL